VGRVESQLVSANGLEVRGNVDAAYDRIVHAMFDCLKQMAKMDGEQGEEKGLINYHVILIGKSYLLLLQGHDELTAICRKHASLPRRP